jgi:hypothetical protein
MLLTKYSDEIAMECGLYWAKRNAYTVLMGKLQWKRA